MVHFTCTQRCDNRGGFRNFSREWSHRSPEAMGAWGLGLATCLELPL